MDDLIDAKRAAEILNCSRQWITKLVRDGKLRGKRLNRQCWAISLTSVEEYAKEINNQSKTMNR